MVANMNIQVRNKRLLIWPPDNCNVNNVLDTITKNLCMF